MTRNSFTTDVDPERAERIVSAARTSVGDTLRSVLYFTPTRFDVLYVRQDLYDAPEAVRERKAPLVEFERMGFAEAPTRSALSDRTARPSIGPYEFTVRFHADGFVVRVVAETDGVLLTADAMDVTAFEEAVTAVRGLLAA